MSFYYNTYRGSKSLPRRSRSPTSPVIPFRSANPAHLPDFSSMNNHQLDYTDDAGAGGAMSRLGHVSPFRTCTMKEYDQQISELKKENFSLKLRIYFLEEKMQQKFAACGKEDDSIELKIQLENLKRELTDKQSLLCSASQALEALESQHQAELKTLKEKCVKEKEHCEQRIDELEKKLERLEGPQAGMTKSKSEEWYRQAFSVADLTVDSNEKSEALIPSLQSKISEMEASIAEMSGKIQAYEQTIQEMKSAATGKEERIDKLVVDKLKRENAIRGLMELVEEKSKECEELSKRLVKQHEDARAMSSGGSVTTRNGASASLPAIDHISSVSSRARSNEDVFQHEILAFEMQTKDKKISDLCEQLNQLQIKLESQAANCLRKDKLVAQLQDSLSSAERNFEELSVRANALADCEKVVEKLRSDLLEKEKDAEDAQVRLDKELNEKGGKLLDAENELERVNAVLRSLESEVRLKTEENKSTYNLLLESKDSIANLQQKLRMHDGYFDKIGSSLNKLFEEVDPVLLNDEKISRVLDDFSKLGGILHKASDLRGQDCDAPKPKSGFSSQVELHHLDLIRDSHMHESAASLLATNLRLKKEAAECLSKAEEAARRSELLEAQLSTANGKKDAEINRLKFVLQSTEGTVRMLGRDLRQCRTLLAEVGAAPPPPLSRCRSGHRVDASLARPWTYNARWSPASTTLVEGQTAPSVMLTKSASFSAPATPMRPVPDLEEKIRTVVVDASCQCEDPGEPALARDAEACKHIAESQLKSELLRRRLEELADFLEGLLSFDENGTLDLSSLTPRKLACIRNQLEETRELSNTLSLSLMALDNTFAPLELSDAGRGSVTGSESASSISGHERDGYATLVNSPADAAIRPQRPPRSCSRSLALGSHQESMADNYVLVLEPDSSAANGAFSVDVDDELPTCSLSTFGLQHSFLSSTNVFESARKRREEASESDSWSEPDRRVSQQRIGLESAQATPRGHQATSSSNTESEMAGFARARSGRGPATPGRGNQMQGSSAHLDATLPLRPALSHSSYVSPAVKRGSYSPQRRGRSKSGDFSSACKSPLRNDVHLREISELKKKLEEAIRDYNLLREQFEKCLAASPKGNAELREVFAGAARKHHEQLEEVKAQLDSRNLQLQDARREKALLMADIEDLTEKFESYKETIESLQSLLGEQQRASKEAARQVERLERELAETRAAREQSQQSLTRAKQLVRDNEAALENMRELSAGLEAECERLRGQCEAVERDGQRREEEMRKSVERGQESARRLEDEKDALQCRVQELLHSIEVKEEEAERAVGEARRQMAAKQSELEETQRAKSGAESRLAELQTQLDAAAALSQSLRIELQMHEALDCDGEAGAQAQSKVDLLMADVRSLHLQLQRSAEANAALMAQLETKDGRGLRLDLGEGSWPCPVSSPDTASSFSYVSGGHRTHGGSEHADAFSSPDLGIESDRSRLSSLDRKRPDYLQPGCPGGSEWTAVNSAPPRATASRITAADHNMTFPACGKAAAGEDSGASDSVACDDRKPYPVAFPVDFEALKNALREGLGVLRMVRSKAKERLVALRGDAKEVRREEYAAWKEAYLGCNALKTCLEEGAGLTARFWTVTLPLVPLGASGEESRLGLEEDLMRLFHELSKEKLRAENALGKLEVAKRREALMHKYIDKELKKTHGVLKITGGNLEQQAKSASSPQK